MPESHAFAIDKKVIEHFAGNIHREVVVDTQGGFNKISACPAGNDTKGGNDQNRGYDRQKACQLPVNRGFILTRERFETMRGIRACNPAEQ